MLHLLDYEDRGYTRDQLDGFEMKPEAIATFNARMQADGLLPAGVEVVEGFILSFDDGWPAHTNYRSYSCITLKVDEDVFGPVPTQWPNARLPWAQALVRFSEEMAAAGGSTIRMENDWERAHWAMVAGPEAGCPTPC